MREFSKGGILKLWNALKKRGGSLAVLTGEVLTPPGRGQEKHHRVCLFLKSDLKTI